MTAKKEREDKPTVVIEGGIRVRKIDSMVFRIELEQVRKGDDILLLGNRTMDLPRNFAPADYEPGKYDISGEFSIKLKIAEK